MGTHEIKGRLRGEKQRSFMRNLLADLRALEQMISENRFESGVRRIGAEQELFLVERNFRPAPRSLQVLEHLGEGYTTELGLFNLEINLDPVLWGGDCLSQMEKQLEERIDRAREAAQALGIDVALTGILPTLLKSDLELNNMTPLPRYRILNRALTKLRGGSYSFHIKGQDELNVTHNSVMLESCNASFQVHFQVGANEFVNLYNLAQLIAPCVLSAAVNSPLLFGLRLWRETRIALFQQSVDTRGPTYHPRANRPRVYFGDGWIKKSVLELYQEDVAHFRTLVGMDSCEDPFATLEAGSIPQLQALRLHNGTVYRWNRACYGITNGEPHLRIENRVLPSGPSVVDEVANAAFWFGLMSQFAHQYEDVSKLIDFGEVKNNFISAARLGLHAQFTWVDGRTWPAQRLILDELLPRAAEGLARGKIREEDAKRYLSVIENRVAREQTGASWILKSLGLMDQQRNPNERMNALVAAMIDRQKSRLPVAEWQPAKLEEAGGWKHTFLRVEQFMSKNLFTVTQDEPIDLVANLMKWERIRHVLVEDDKGRLIGLVSYRALLRAMADGWNPKSEKTLAVSDIMKRDPICISPDTPALRAIEIMRDFKIACLPVVKNAMLVGVITESDFMDVAADMLAQKLKE